MNASRRLLAPAALIVLSSACGSAGTAAPVTTGGATSGATDLSAYYITPALCTDASGPDCSKLRLGDSYFTTSGPAVGKLFSCVGANVPVPSIVTIGVPA